MSGSSSSEGLSGQNTAGISGQSNPNGNPSSSSGFTDEEILAELQYLGYSLSPKQLIGLKKELDKLVLQDEALEQRQEAAFFQSLRGTQGPSPDQLVAGSLPPFVGAQFAPTSSQGLYYQPTVVQSPPTRTEEIRGQAPGAVPAQGWNYARVEEKLLKEAEEVIRLTDDRRRLLREVNTRLGRQYPKVEKSPAESDTTLTEDDGDEAGVEINGEGPKTKSVRFEDTVAAATEAYEKKALKDLGKAIRNNLPEMDKWKSEIFVSPEAMERYLKASEKVVKGDKLLEPTIRPVVYPDAGGLPFRHDPVKRAELYRKEWEKYPPPGEKKRLDLRWKVREYMLRQDIPKLVK